MTEQLGASSGTELGKLSSFEFRTTEERVFKIGKENVSDEAIIDTSGLLVGFYGRYNGSVIEAVRPYLGILPRLTTLTNVVYDLEEELTEGVEAILSSATVNNASDEPVIMGFPKKHLRNKPFCHRLIIPK